MTSAASSLDARPLVYGHRGCALAPENTIPAFDRALASGADGLEMDVRLSRDGVPMVHHDADLERCTDGRGPLAALTADELGTLDAGCHFAADEGFPFRGRGVVVPTLSDVLARYPTVPIILEVKSYSEAAARAVVETLRRASAGDRVCVAAFDHATLKIVRRLAPAQATSASRDEIARALRRSWLWLGPPRPAYRAVQVPERSGSRRVVSRRFVRLLHGAGIPIQVWTVNDAPDMRRLLDWGVDGLITDRPGVAARTRDQVLAGAVGS